MLLSQEGTVAAATRTIRWIPEAKCQATRVKAGWCYGWLSVRGK